MARCLTVAHQQNGQAERFNRTIFQQVRCM